MDLKSLAIKTTGTLHLRHPVSQEKLFDGGDEKKPVTIEMHSTSSKQYRNAVSAMQNRALRRQQKKEKMTAETLREEQIELLVACSAGSTHLELEGKAIKTEEDFRKLYSNPEYSWIMDQASEYQGETANFFSE